jgi:hypothetical protein
MQRLRRCLRLFATVDTTLVHIAPALLQPLYLHSRIELAPRLSLTVRPQQPIETHRLWQFAVDGAKSSPVERVSPPVTVCQVLRERQSPPLAFRAPSIVARLSAHGEGRLPHALTTTRQPCAIEMVVHRPQIVASTQADNLLASVCERPQVTEHPSSPRSNQTIPLLDGNYLRHLTDSVVDALDRRSFAAFERTGRRFT